MKELSINEKAKAYDKAIERAKKIYGNGIIERIFPELKESDDERIKKNCIHFLELQKQHHAATFEIEECIAWLEKQCKQLADKNEPRFEVGDWVVFNGLTLYIKEVVKGFYRTISKGGIVNSYDWDIDNIARLWVIQDAKDGDVLVNGSNIFIFYFINNRRLMGYCHVNMNDGNFYNDIGRIECFCTIDAPVTPATKEQRDALMKAMNDAGYVWDAEKKELMELIKPKFDPKTLQPFDKVLVRDDSLECWEAQLFSHIIKDDTDFPYVCTNDSNRYCIPYNEETKHLVGTSDEAPKFYSYWED